MTMRLGTKHKLLFGMLVVFSFSLVIAGFSLSIQETSASTVSKEDQTILELKEVRALLKKNSFAEAETLAREILADVNVRYGPVSMQAVQILGVLIDSVLGKLNKHIRNEYMSLMKQGVSTREADVLAESILLKKKQEVDDYRALIERSVSIQMQLLGPEHPDVLQSLNDFASRLMRTSGDFIKAKELASRALRVSEKIYGPDHVESVEILYTLASMHHWKRFYDESREFLEKALKINEEEYGPEHLKVAEGLDRMGGFFGDTGQLKSARTHYERALAIREKLLGPDHQDIVKSLFNLRSVLNKMGAYDEVLANYEQSLSILEKTNGPESEDLASLLTEFTGFLMDPIGDYTKAKYYEERTLRINEKIYGAESERAALNLNTLAVIHRLLGDNEKAKLLYKRSLAIHEKLYGSENPAIVFLLINLSGLSTDMGDYEEAEAYSKRALEIGEKAAGPDYLGLAPILSSYAYALLNLEKFDLVEKISHRVLGILEKNAGHDNHFLIVRGLRDIASIHHRMGEKKSPLSLMSRAQEVTERSLGPEHDAMKWILSDFSLYLWCDGQASRALHKALKCMAIERNHLHLFASSLAERQALAYAESKTQGFDVCLSLAAKNTDGTANTISKAWNALIQSRALIFDALAARNRIVIETGNPEIAALANSLASSRQHLSDLIVRGPATLSPEENYIDLVEEARNEKESAELALAQASRAFREERQQRHADFTEVKNSLPPDFALVAYARYLDYEPINKADEKEEEKLGTSREFSEVPSYVALILQAQRDTPLIIPLGSAEEIERLVFDWGQEVARGTRIPGRSLEEAEVAYRTSGEALRRKVWDPLASFLGNSKGVFVVPDGILHTVNFAALPVGADKYLIENGPLIHYLSAERDLVSSGESHISGAGLLAMGNPDFDETALFAAFNPEKDPQKNIRAKDKSLLPFRGTRSGCGDFKSLKFTSLPSSQKEMEEISDIWRKGKKQKENILNLRGEMATEHAFKMTAPGKQVLHLATHGFFLEGECASVLTRLGNQRKSEWAGMGELPPAAGENPLLLSGLALAGANQREAAGPEEEDGILTAEEVASLDLSGVKLAVLSACDTGVGKIKAGEGVFGLRRAFRLAGVRTLITSLWPVEDDAARKWMRTFYRAQFIKKMGITESIREASLAVLREQRKKRKCTHPFYWAGFVASGDWQ